mmetsp:Transcript_40043/g.52436  ORF Transcript_40043/g.52436 Transcript_40043/m.52436 type:complete len:132 (-) Transcript_40043:803-1198(-)|eukprot:CAMPEP_0185583936 /NCGR_PEP_ID=MMETSP0434-20130131/29023_1 /TAXON_ID=626734 ORGANISM="Favella taraikaensis, Strain Fe Narragansett Bay" /NCGR_SAMPLE_ID=MMETSP0434 /ASSEMBLY_ACC=CAM_ASM_000379 /LENGTH=131 /DNA_ID=CAMNT_0028203365 /DNA_START=972 /DNA_END=1367 /DNA_ORIENTATION=-
MKKELSVNNISPSNSQEKIKVVKNTIDIGKTSGRDPDAIMKGTPMPPDSRFETLKGNIEVVSKFKNSKATTDFNSAPKRTELWGLPQPQVDFSDNRTYWKPKSTLPFDPKLAGHLPSNEKKPFRVPDGYSY